MDKELELSKLKAKLMKLQRDLNMGITFNNILKKNKVVGNVQDMLKLIENQDEAVKLKVKLMEIQRDLNSSGVFPSVVHKNNLMFDIKTMFGVIENLEN